MKGVSLLFACYGNPLTDPPCQRCPGHAAAFCLSLISQYPLQVLASVCEWDGQALPALRAPADLRVRLVREGNRRRVWQGNDRGVAVRGGSIPGIDRAGEARRHRLGVL